MTVQTGQVVLDLSDDAALTATIAQLNNDTRLYLIHLLRAACTTDTNAHILSTVRAVLAEDAPDQEVIGVQFLTNPNNDNGAFLDPGGAVLFADGDVEQFDFGDTIEDFFAQEFGNHGPNYVLAVDLRTDTITNDGLGGRTDGTGSLLQGVTSIYDRFNVPHLNPARPDST